MEVWPHALAFSVSVKVSVDVLGAVLLPGQMVDKSPLTFHM